MYDREPQGAPTPPAAPAALVVATLATATFVLVWNLTGNADAAAAVALGVLSLRPETPPSRSE